MSQESDVEESGSEVEESEFEVEESESVGEGSDSDDEVHTLRPIVEISMSQNE